MKNKRTEICEQVNVYLDTGTANRATHLFNSK